MLRDELFLASLLVLIVVVLLVLGAVLYFAIRRGEAKPGADPQVVKLRFGSLRSSFRQAIELIESNIAARPERYRIPWVLVLNEGASSRQLPLGQSGIASALSVEATSATAAQGISWNFFDKGIVIDVQGAYLGAPDDEDAAQKPWDEFLGLCRAYRPQRPFDSVVLTVPAALLLDGGADARLELGKLARIAHRRLWLAQNRFAMRFAVYVVVSDCERIDGFPAFARALPEPMKASILGWSSPYDLSSTYQGEWLGDAMDSMVRAVSDASAELFALDTGSADVADFFLLPARIESMRDSLSAYVDELMRPSAYHEPFFLRGIYLSGDASEAAQKAVSAAADESAPEGTVVPAAVPQSMREPAFLRDLFEKKIFMEWGVARPSRQQLTRPMLSRVARFGMAGVLGVWVVGLVVTGIQLHRRTPELVRLLGHVEADANFRAVAAERGDPVPPEWYRSRTVSLLAEIDKLESSRPWRFFMPGASAFVDDLDARVEQRIAREFGELAIGTLRRELYARAAELTGVAQDPSTSELIIGGECALPPAFAAIAKAPHKAALAPEDLPEAAAMSEYLSAVDRLDQAIVAMVRLQKPDGQEGEHLRLLVKYTLGAELPGNLARSAGFFHRTGSAGPSPTAISVRPIQQAVRCTLDKGMAALDRRAFTDNDLLLLERHFAVLSARMFAPDAIPSTFDAAVGGYKDIIDTIRFQEMLVGSGKGAWMHQSSLSLGPAYEALFKRITESRRLLGQDAADPARQHARAELQRFRADFNALFGPGTASGIVWQDKEGRYAIAPERAALRDALNGLLSQPFVVPTADRPLPAPSGANVVAWDTAKLDHALALADSRKAFLTETLPKFPPAVRPSIVGFVNAQFARLVSDDVVGAVTVLDRAAAGTSGEPAVFEAARMRLLKVQQLLAETGAQSRAESLRSLMSQDAMQRLRILDDKLQETELYAMRGQDFASWKGERGPVLVGFGVRDGGGLVQYLAAQFSRAEALSRASESYFAALEPADLETPVARRWRAINREVERYRLKNPNGTLLAYEQFLTTVGSDLDGTNCAEKLEGKAPASRPADYFGERYLQVYTALTRRCSELQAGQMQRLWASFSSDFNRLVASRAPFANPSARDPAEADLDDVSHLTRAFDDFARSFKHSAAASRSPGAYVQVRRFAEQFEQVRAFLAPLYPKEEGAVAGYDMSVEFRAKQSDEIEGNQVIDWTLEVGSEVLRLRDAPHPLRWEPGTPITLTLRLAKDAPYEAAFDPQQPYMAADGKTVVYRFANTWSLLRMIQMQRDASANARSDSRSQLLRLEFPLVRAGGPGNYKVPANAPRARVYMRIALSPVGKRTPVFWPAAFPNRAPELQGQ